MIALVVLSLFNPNVAAIFPTVTCPPATVVSGTILVTVLKTLLPDVVLPNVGPVIVSEIILPAMSVPVTVKLVDDKSPPSDKKDIVPFNDE